MVEFPSTRTMQLRFLGGYELCCDQQRIAKPATSKSQSLLAYLVIHRQQAHAREHLAELYWREWPPEKSRHNLTTALWRIRACLPDRAWLMSESQLVQFDPGVHPWLDIEDFEAQASQGDFAGLGAALELYRGEFLPGFYEDWVISERYRLEALYLNTLARWMAQHEKSGDCQVALASAQRLLQLDPLREDAHRGAMRAYCLLGRREKALEQYQRCRQILNDELGVEPVAETAELYNAIIEGRLTRAPASLGAPGSTLLDLEGLQPVLALGRDPMQAWTPARMIGRERELALLEQAWRRALAGDGGLALVVGEAGVGKSRLLAEFARRLKWAGARAYTGYCYPFERLLPYQPLAEVIRALVADLSLNRLAEIPDWALQELSALAPEVGERRPDLRAPESGATEENRARLFESVKVFFAQVAAPKAILVALEDLHWAGESTLQMLHYLSRQLAGCPVLFAGTARPEEITEGHPLRAFQEQLGRAGRLARLPLAPLPEPAVTELVLEMSAAGQAAAPLAKRLFAETEGNPFYLMEMVKAIFEAGLLSYQDGAWRGDYAALSQADLPLPVSLSQTILARAQGLAPDAKKALDAAAVLGVEFDFEPFYALIAGGQEPALEALEALLRRRLIDESDHPGRRDYAFAHHKIQEVVYAGIPLRRRAYLHRRAGEALERLSDPEKSALAGELAHHFLNAREADPALTAKAVAYLNQAGNQARNMHAHQEAIGYYEQALALYRQAGDQEGAARAWMKLGMTHHSALAYERARQAFGESFALLRGVAWSAPTRRSPAPHALRCWFPNEPVTLDPARCVEVSAMKIAHQLFRGPVEMDAELDVTPALFQSWEVSPDGRRYTFRLQKEVCWSDGQALSAGDFEYAWKRLLDPALNLLDADLFYVLEGARAYHQGASPDPERVGVRALNDRTLEVELEEPAGYFLHLLAHNIAFPLPRHVLKEQSDPWMAPGEGRTKFVSNGAFVLESWMPGEALTLARNPMYMGARAGNLEEARVYFSDWAQALERYGAGALDVLDLTYLTKQERASAYRRHPDEVLTVPSQAVVFIHLNTDAPPLNDLRVRRALALALDKRRLAISAIEGDPATGGAVPPGFPGFTPHINLPFDPQEARQLLAQAGYPGGRGFPPLRAYAQSNPKYAFLGDELAWQWHQNLGVEPAWTAFPTEVFFKVAILEKPDLCCFGLMAEYPDPDYFLHKGILPAMRREYFPGYLDRLRAARRLQDPLERLACYRALDIDLVEQAAIIPLVYQRLTMLVKPWVKGFPLAPFVEGAWKDVAIEPHA